MNAESLTNQIAGMKMMKEAEKLAKLLAEQAIAKHKMRENVRRVLSDPELRTALRAQAWLEADPSKVTVHRDGKIEIADEGWPLGCGSHESEITSRVQRRMYADESEREANAWLFSDGEDP